MIGESLAARLIGIIAGTFLSLTFLPPRSVSGFIRRGLSALVFGWILAPVIHDYLEWPVTDERIIASAAIASFSSWWLMGAGKKIAEKLGNKEV